MSTYQRRERQREAQSKINTLKTGSSYEDTGTMYSDNINMKSPRVARMAAEQGKRSINDNGRPTAKGAAPNVPPNLRREMIEIKRKK